LLGLRPGSDGAPQGAGKTFNLELCLKKMGVSPVCLSAGELEDEWAGEPGRRLRERYSFAGGGPQLGEVGCARKRAWVHLRPPATCKNTNGWMEGVDGEVRQPTLVGNSNGRERQL
jgi:hypothetical protein